MKKKINFFEKFFNSRWRVCLLRYLFFHFSPIKIKEIKKFFGPKIFPFLKPEIKKLNQLSLLRKKGENYYLNESHFAFSEIKSLVSKFSPEFFEESLKKFKKIPSLIFLSFGGIFSPENVFLPLSEERLDILIVVKKNQKDIERKIAKIVSSLEKETGKELNFMILSEKEFKYRYSMFDKFIHSFFEKNPVILINKMRGINL